MRSSLFTFAVVAAFGCGSNASEQKPAAPAPEQKSESRKATAAEDQALQKEFDSLPENVVIAVPVDANGNELVDKAEMRLQKSGTITEASVESAFAASSAPAKVAKSELDSDSSTQSWYEWRPGYGANQSSASSQSNNTNVNLSDINNSNVDVNVTNNNNYYNQQTQQQGQFQGGYYNNYRPWSYSTVWTGYYWGYSRPTCYSRPFFRYYVYPRGCRRNCF